MTDRPNVSSDLLWEIVRHNNAYLVKSKANGGVQFSRDPFNLTNKHSKKNAGFINDKAVSIQTNEKGGMTLMTKKSGKANKPSQGSNSYGAGKGKGGRKTYKTIADTVGKRGYRSDLNLNAVQRASALKDAQRTKKETPARKPRGPKARKEAE